MTEQDHQSTETSSIKLANLLSVEQWIRALFMLLFAFIAGVAYYVVGVLVIIQFIWVLLTGRRNQRLLNLGQSLSNYLFQILQFLTYNEDSKPFPFSDWPENDT